MSDLIFSCEQMDQRFEAAVDGDLPGDEERAYRAHLAGCHRCANEHEKAEALAKELVMIMIEDKEIESRALAASRRAINRIETDRAEVRKAEAKVRRRRNLFLAGSWVGALAIIVRGGFLIEAESGITLESILASQQVATAANMFAVSPLYLMIGAVVLIAAASFSLRFALIRD